MITSKHLKIYANYEGDGDMLVRIGSNKDKKMMSYEVWSLIDDLLQTLEAVEKGLASDKFKSEVLKKLQNSCDSIETQQKLKGLVGKW